MGRARDAPWTTGPPGVDWSHHRNLEGAGRCTMTSSSRRAGTPAEAGNPASWETASATGRGSKPDPASKAS